MVAKNLKFIGIIKVAALIAAAFICNSAIAFESESFDCNIFSRSFIDSSRCDYYETVYTTDSTEPTYKKKQYDKSFLGSCSNMDFKLKTDIGDNSFIDFSENLYWRHYNEEEPNSLGYDAYRYNELNHMFNLKWALLAGDSDIFELNYYNSALVLDGIKSLNNRSNKGTAIFSHVVGEKSCFTIKGSAEERIYQNDPAMNYRESGILIRFSSNVPTKNEYKQISNSVVGDKEYFKTVPGLKPTRAIDYYTDYDINPNDPDPDARYRRHTEVGEIVYNIFGGAYSGKYKNIHDEYSQAKAGLVINYETAEDMTLRISDTYKKTKYDREMMLNWLYDNTSNIIAVSLDHDLCDNAAQTLTYTNENVNYSNREAKSYKVNSISYEGFYSFGKSAASILVGAARKRYEDPAFFYPNENETRFDAAYDYKITDSIKFKLKGELVKSEYLNFENELYSNYHRHSLRAGIEKSFSQATALELAFQQNIERHDTFTQNNQDEKIVGLNLISNF